MSFYPYPTHSLQIPPLPNDHFENFLIRCISSNCPRPLCAIKHIAHALIYVFNSAFSTWNIECMPQSHGHHQARYNLCHIRTPRKSSGSWTLVFQIPSACKYCTKMLRNPPARCFIVIFISQKFYLSKQETKKKNTLLMLYLKLLDIQHFQPYVPEMFCIQIMVSFLWRRLSMVYHASKPLLSRLSSSKKINIHCIVMSFKEIFKHDKCTYLMSRKFFSR